MLTKNNIDSFEGRRYISTIASNEAMVKPGEITEVFYFDAQEPCSEKMIRYYVTDGWIEIDIGRYIKTDEQLLALGRLLLNKPLGEADDCFYVWCAKNKKEQSNA